MSDSPSSGHDTLPPELVDRIDAACDRFEAAWKAAAPGAEHLPPCMMASSHDTPRRAQGTSSSPRRARSAGPFSLPRAPGPATIACADASGSLRGEVARG
jgi:hypothetical protein